MLCFDNGGKTQTFDLEIDESCKDQASIVELTELMKKLAVKV